MSMHCAAKNEKVFQDEGKISVQMHPDGDHYAQRGPRDTGSSASRWHFTISLCKPSHLWSLPELSRGEVKSRELNDLVAHGECILLKREVDSITTGM